MNSSTLNSRPVFANSKLEAGKRIEALRQRRIELRGQERQALLAEAAAERAAESAVEAETAAGGRKLAGLCDETAVVRARGATKAANATKRDRVKQAAELHAAVSAVEEEVDTVLAEHREELVEEAVEAFAARADAVSAAAGQLQHALELLHEQAGGAFALWQAVGADTAPLPQPDAIRRLERSIGELLGQVPDALPVEHALAS